MTPRRCIALTLYLIMVGVGVWCVYEWLVLGGRGIAFKIGAFPALLGLYLLWIDFLSPNRNQL